MEFSRKIFFFIIFDVNSSSIDANRDSVLLFQIQALLIRRILNSLALAITLLLLLALNIVLVPPYNFIYLNDKQDLIDHQPWFLKYGKRRPLPVSVDAVSGKRIARIWPHEDNGDRVVDQLMFVPPDISQMTQNGTRLKKIFLNDGLFVWTQNKIQVSAHFNNGRDVFQRYRCPVDTCTITSDRWESADADAIIFKNALVKSLKRKHPNQVWIFYLLESPLNTQTFDELSQVFNWTSTYRHDSDIPILYAKFILYDPNVTTLPLAKNYASNKIHKVAWFVSNCKAYNHRMEYAENLSKYIQVDVYGKCGSKTCPRSQANYCLNKIGSEYKFYLAFENSNCRDYITEKFFLNALSYDILPIVMGAPKEDYERVAPYNSFIHVDDFESPKHLADYLHVLDNNDTMYNEYFKWKGTGEIMYDDFYLCRVCAMLHDKQPPKVIDNLEKWWRGPGICTSGSWKNR